MFKDWIYVCFIWNVFFYSDGVNGVTEDTEAEIKKKVLQNYDPSLPPNVFSKNAYAAFVNFRIYRIRSLDEKKGELFVEGSLLRVWIDTRFSWESDNINKFSAQKDEIWMPPFYIYNRIGPEEITSNPLPVVLQRNAYWEPRCNIRTSCDVNLKYYPFDKHICDIIIASHSTEGDVLSTTVPPFFASFAYTYQMTENPQWSHDPPKAFQKNMKINDDAVQKVIVFRFSVQRSMPLIPLSILTPCLCCALLVLTTYWMTAGSPFRAGLCITSMFISSSSLFTLGRLLPASGSSTPVIVEYVSITLILSVFSSIQTVVSSVMRRCETLPPISYTTIISKIPFWCLWMMRIVPEKEFIQQMDQTFLFSELDDIEKRNNSEKENANLDVREKPHAQSVQLLWEKYAILIDRIMFYLQGLILLLFIISVIVTE